MLPPQHLPGNRAKLALLFEHLDPLWAPQTPEPLTPLAPVVMAVLVGITPGRRFHTWASSHPGDVRGSHTLTHSEVRLTSSQAYIPPLPSTVPQAPRLCLLPCLDQDIKFNVIRDCGASARPAPDDNAVPTEKGRKPFSNWAPDPAPCSQGSLQPHTGPWITQSADTLSRGCLGVIDLCLSLHSSVSSCSAPTHPSCSQPAGWICLIKGASARTPTLGPPMAAAAAWEFPSPSLVKPNSQRAATPPPPSSASTLRRPSVTRQTRAEG